MILLLFACTSEPHTPEPPAAAAPFEIASIEWEVCDLYTEGGGPEAGCAVVQTPLDMDDRDGPTIDVFVKRYRPEGGTGANALWLLQGGPGASGYVFEGLSEVFATRFPDVDYYFPDHRGTGRSTRLTCAAEGDDTVLGRFIDDSEWDACQAEAEATYGEDLASFSTTNAANDVGLLIDAMQRSSDQPVFVYGVSYGTYWAHRYLQLYPDQAEGVILDSIAAPGMSLYRQDEDANTAAELFFDACGADPFCAAKLGDDPWSVADGLVQRLKDGHCSSIAVEGIDTHVLFRRAFGSLLMDPFLRPYIPAIVYRADRCSLADVEALQVLMGVLTQEQPESLETVLWGYLLTQNVIVSEFNESPAPTPELLAAIREDAVASRDITTMLEQTLDWPAYPSEPYIGQFAATDTPMLMLNGGLDPATLLSKARVLQPHFTGPHQTWVEFPTATHTTIASSPFIDEIGETRSCATRMLMAFVGAPEAEIDQACRDAVLPLDFTLTSSSYVPYNRALFGTTDAWE